MTEWIKIGERSYKYMDERGEVFVWYGRGVWWMRVDWTSDGGFSNARIIKESAVFAYQTKGEAMAAGMVLLCR